MGYFVMRPLHTFKDNQFPASLRLRERTLEGSHAENDVQYERRLFLKVLNRVKIGYLK